MGGILVRKLVKPTKVVCSWTPHECRFGQIRPPQAQPYIRTAGAGVLGETDTTVRQELGGFDPPDRVLNQVAELLALFVADGCPEVLNLDQAFADKHHLSHVCDTCDPGIANQLRIQGQQSGRLFRIAAGGGLPLDEAAGAVELSDGIDVGHEGVLPGYWVVELDLQVSPRLK